MFDINNPPQLTLPTADPRVARAVEEARSYGVYISKLASMPADQARRVNALRKDGTISSLITAMDIVLSRKPSLRIVGVAA